MERDVAWQIAYLIIFGTLATFLLWAWGQARMSATHAAVIFSLEPVFATAFAVLLRGSAEWTGDARNPRRPPRPRRSHRV